MSKPTWKLPVLVSLLPLLAACGAARPGTIDESKPVCKDGQQWDGAQCVGTPEGADPGDQPASP